MQVVAVMVTCTIKKESARQPVQNAGGSRGIGAMWTNQTSARNHSLVQMVLLIVGLVRLVYPTMIDNVVYHDAPYDWSYEACPNNK